MMTLFWLTVALLGLSILLAVGECLLYTALSWIVWRRRRRWQRFLRARRG